MEFRALTRHRVAHGHLAVSFGFSRPEHPMSPVWAKYETNVSFESNKERQSCMGTRRNEYVTSHHSTDSAAEVFLVWPTERFQSCA